MILIGLTTWSEHPALLQKEKPTLAEYASCLPLVEIDTTFYGIPRKTTVEKWAADTPKDFRFFIKAHQAMTLQADWKKFFESEESMFQSYLEAMEPVYQQKKLAAFLFQFPPYFNCTKENVAYLQKIRKIFADFPIAIEFRSASWYDSRYKKNMHQFMQNIGVSLVTVDEPQVPTNPVPLDIHVTNPELAILRLHGRNTAGWLEKGKDWRKKRTLYRYSRDELEELAKITNKLAKQAKQVLIIFNNNSAGDAAPNAKELQNLLNISYHDLNPQQLGLF